MSQGAIKKKLVHSFSVRYSTEAVSCPQQRVGVNNGRRTLTLLRLAGLMCKYTYGRGPGPHVRKGRRVWWPFSVPVDPGLLFSSDCGFFFEWQVMSS